MTSRTITHNKILVGGVPLSFDFDARLLSLGEEIYTVDEWRDIERHIDVMVTGKLGIRKRNTKAVPNISEFVLQNLPFINKTKKGKMKSPPFWLRPFYGAVVTKEELHAEPDF